MRAENLLSELRRRRVVLSVHRDGGLRFNAPESNIPTDLMELARRCRDQLKRLVIEAWWPPDFPRPNVMSLGTRFGAVATTAALAALGCDLAVRTPTWEEIFVVALQLEGGDP